MQIIAHRINTVEQLRSIPLEYGIELDVRYHEDRLILHHDPFGHHISPKPCFFEDLLQEWVALMRKGTMILNIKTEGIEKQCIALMNKYNIHSWFFLDLSMPYFAIYAENAYNGIIDGFTPDNLAVRFSEREPIEYALAFKNKAGWVWIDCFTHLPLDYDSYTKLRDAGLKICIVAPELQKHPVWYTDEFLKKLNGLSIDAVCTKYPELWNKQCTAD